MFALVAGDVERPLQERTFGPTVVSMAGHLLVAAMVILPALYLTNKVPPVPTMLAFVAEPPTLLPPPAQIPPSDPPRPVPAPSRPLTQPVRPAISSPVVAQPEAPVNSPAAITQENEAPGTTNFTGVEGGIAGGSEGGLLSGEGAGVLGEKSVAERAALPQPTKPVRVGGLVKPPELVRRVQPKYPDSALAARAEGVVILEAEVRADGRVESVRVLASASPLLEAPAVEAVKQWIYAPVILDGAPAPFILTVTVNFSLRR